MRKSTKLPEGVGRKIIEALKSQPQSSSSEAPKDSHQTSFDNLPRLKKTELRRQPQKPQHQPAPQQAADIDWDEDEDLNQPFQLEEDVPGQNFAEELAYDATADGFEYETESDTDNNDSDEYNYEEYQQETYDNSEEEESYPQYESNEYPEYTNANESTEVYEDDAAYEEYTPSPLDDEHAASSEERFKSVSDVEDEDVHSDFNIATPSSVDILINLVYHLPAGVTKQTGAQIIRQTMEAMGLPMNKVLSEAQKLQDNLGIHIKNNINTIEEYRNNIKTLEKEVQQAKGKSKEMEELISLFTLTDR